VWAKLIAASELKAAVAEKQTRPCLLLSQSRQGASHKQVIGDR
jgi:hypothetical protein